MIVYKWQEEEEEEGLNFCLYSILPHSGKDEADQVQGEVTLGHAG